MLESVGAIFVAVAIICVLPLLGVLAGAFSGWVVGFFFTDTILGFLARCGFDTDGLQVWQIGAALGFLGSFFRTSVTNNK